MKSDDCCKCKKPLTGAALLEDMKQFGKEVSKTKESALAFLKKMGLLDEEGKLKEPYK